MKDNFDIPNSISSSRKAINKMRFTRNRFIIVLIAIIIIAAISFFTYRYIAPFGTKIIYQFNPKDDIDKVSILDGAEQSQNIDNNASNTLIIPQQIIRSNIVTFNLKLLSKQIDGIWINLKFKGSPKEIKIGVKGNTKDSYSYKPLYNALLESLKNEQTENGLLFWQRDKKYSDITDFIKKPPSGKLIASYYTDSANINVVNVKPGNNFDKLYSTTRILRGTHTVYTKVVNTPFILNIEKQDGNMYIGEDTLSIQVFKGDKKVASKEIPDDGITDASTLKLATQKVSIKIDNPETGIYKIVLLDKTKNADIYINKVELNQPLFVFSPSFLVVDDKPATIWTNSNKLSAITYHGLSLQTVKLDDKIDFKIDKIMQEFPYTFNDKISSESAILSESIHKIYMPKNDLILKGDGYFAFSKESLFNPTPNNVIQLLDIKEDTKVDYILADYQKVIKSNDWKTAQAHFDPKDIKINGDKLYFSLESPGLTESGGEIAIDNLEVTVDKPGWFSPKENSDSSALFGGSKTSVKSSFIDQIINFIKNLWPFGKNTEDTANVEPTTKPKSTEVKARLYFEVLNGGAQPGAASKFAQILKDNDFNDVMTGNTVEKNYTEATIKYKENKILKSEQDKSIKKITELLKKQLYKVTQDKMSTRNNVISIILGAKQSSSPSATPKLTLIPTSSPSATPAVTHTPTPTPKQ